MAKQTKKAAEATVKVKKSSSVKVRLLSDARPFLTAYRDIDPLNVLTDDQLVAEGYRPPHVRKITEFDKTPAEKEALRKAKFKVGYHTPWAPPSPYERLATRVTVKLKQKADRLGNPVNRNDSTFQNTKSAMVKPSELFMYLQSLNTKTSQVVSYTYNGQTTTVSNG